jgi:hypothetical protein
MSNRRGQKFGIQRGDRRRFPYEPRVIGGKLLMPAELQAIHRYVVKTPALEAGPFGLNSYRSFRQSVDMALKLRPTGLGSGIDKDRADSITAASGRSAASMRPAALPAACAGSGR